MTINETAKILKKLYCVYPNFFSKIDIDMAINSWYAILAKDDFPKIENSVIELCRTNKYPPTISEILENVKKEPQKTFKEILDERKDLTPEQKKALVERRF